MCLSFRKQRTAMIHSSWLDPRENQEMTIVGSKRMIVYGRCRAIGENPNF